MQVALLIVGIGLVVFGGLVLLRFPDRPGGTLSFRGARVDSVGAGLPLVVLGVVLLVFAATQAADDGGDAAGDDTQTVADDGGAEPPPTSAGDDDGDGDVTSSTEAPDEPAAPADDERDVPDCVEDHLATAPDVPLYAAHILFVGGNVEVSALTSAVVVKDGADAVGVVRLQFEPDGAFDDPGLTMYDVVDAECQPVEWVRHDVERGAVISAPLDGRSYEVRVDWSTEDPAYTALVTLQRAA